MKKLLLILSSLFLLLGLSACSVGDMFIDEVAVHNGLVEALDNVLDSEEAFFQEYIILFDGDTPDALRGLYNDFVAAAADLDTYFIETEFASSQNIFREGYNSFYRPFVNEYISYAEGFVTALETEGVSFEIMEPFLDELDQYTLDFVDTHNKLIDTVNEQSTE